jgi:hypothetical protein
MHAIVTIVLVWVAIAIGISILYSLNGQVIKVELWKREVARSMHKNHNVTPDVARTIVDARYRFAEVAYLTDTTAFNVLGVANELFWNEAQAETLTPAHFVNRQLPEELYFHPTWGGVIVEV